MAFKPIDTEKIEDEFKSLMEEYNDSLRKLVPGTRSLFGAILNARRELSSQVDLARRTLTENKRMLASITRQREQRERELRETTANITEIRKQRLQLATQLRQAYITINQTEALINAEKGKITSINRDIQASRDHTTSLELSNRSIMAELEVRRTAALAIEQRKQAGESLSTEEQRALEQYYTLTRQLTDNEELLRAEEEARQQHLQKLATYESELQRLTVAGQEQTAEFQRLKKEHDKLKEQTTLLMASQASLTGVLQKLGEKFNIFSNKVDDSQKEFDVMNGRTKKLEVMRKVADVFIGLAREIDKLVKIVRDTQQAFGLAAGEAAKLQISNLKESIKSVVDTFATGGKEAPVFRKDILGIQEGFFDEFGDVVSSARAEELARYAKENGVTAKMLTDARRAFLTTSFGDVNKAIAAQTKFINDAKRFGLTIKGAYLAIGQYSELFAKNGARFATSFARAAADAKKIGVDLGKIDQIGDNIIGNFEGFLENTAELGAMGFNLDFNRLAQVAETSDTGTLMRELQKELRASGKDLSNLRRSEQLKFSEAFGLTISEFQRLTGEITGSGEKKAIDPAEEAQKANGFLESILERLTGWNFDELFTRVTNLLEASGPIASAVGKIINFAARTMELFYLAGIYRNTMMGAMGPNLPGYRNGLRGLVNMGGSLIPLGAGLTMGSTVSAAAGAGATGLAAIGATTVAGLGAGLLIGNQFNTSLAEGGSGTLGDWWKYAVGTSPEEKEAIANTEATAQQMGYSSFAELQAANKAKRKAMIGNDVVSRSGYGDRTLVTPTGVIALNNQDNILAYADDMIQQDAGITMLSKGALMESSGLPPQFDQQFTKLLQSINTYSAHVSRALTQMATNQQNVLLDGDRVGKVLNTTTRSVSVLGILEHQNPTLQNV